LRSRVDAVALGPVALVALGLNGIVGVGIFVAPPIVAGAVPDAAGALVYLAVAIACTPIALAYARLARAFPVDGGPVLYASRAFGERVGGGVGVLVWVSATFAAAAVTRAFAELAAPVVRVPAPAIVAVIAAAMALANLRGLRIAAAAWTVLTVAKLVPLVVIASLGAFASGAPSSSTRAPIGRALLAVLFALQGFEVVPLPAGQTRDPERIVPRATIGALAGAGALYAAVHFACARALPDLASQSEAIPAAAAALGGAPLAWLVSAGVAASMGGIVVGYHAMTPRYLSAMRVAPRAVDPPAIALTAILVAPLAAIGSLGTLLDLASVSVLVQYGATLLALATLALRRRDGLAPRDAWPVPIALAVVGVLAAQASLRELLVGAGVGIAGAVIVSVVPRAPRA